MADALAAFDRARKILNQASINIVSENLTKPWGGFFVIDESQASAFVRQYFPEEEGNLTHSSGKLSPKFLVVAPAKRLSWQYHHRRGELWRCLEGKVGVITSMNNQEGDLLMLDPGDKIQLSQGERHRLIGLKEWSIVAEIWIHTDPDDPSDEEDIVRLQDDFMRQ